MNYKINPQEIAEGEVPDVGTQKFIRWGNLGTLIHPNDLMTLFLEFRHDVLSEKSGGPRYHYFHDFRSVHGGPEKFNPYTNFPVAKQVVGLERGGGGNHSNDFSL